MRGDIAESLRIKLSRQRSHTKCFYRIGDDLSAFVVHLQRRIVVLIDEHFERLESTANGFLADFAATTDAVLLRAHVKQGVANQIFFANQNAGCLWAANSLAAAKRDHVEAECRISPEPL